MSLEDRFWAKVDKGGPDECWLWTGALTPYYGQIQEGGRGSRQLKAHRTAAMSPRASTPTIFAWPIKSRTTSIGTPTEVCPSLRVGGGPTSITTIGDTTSAISQRVRKHSRPRQRYAESCSRTTMRTGESKVNDTRVDRVSMLASEAQGCGNAPEAVRILHFAVEEWSEFADELPFGDVDVARVGILLRKSRGRFSANDIQEARTALSAAKDAIRKVAER